MINENNNYIFHNVKYDDYVLKIDDGLNDWSQICQSCVIKYNVEEKYLDKDAGSGICGVLGCDKESDHYIDFDEKLNK